MKVLQSRHVVKVITELSRHCARSGELALLMYLSDSMSPYVGREAVGPVRALELVLLDTYRILRHLKAIGVVIIILFRNVLGCLNWFLLSQANDEVEAVLRLVIKLVPRRRRDLVLLLGRCGSLALGMLQFSFWSKTRDITRLFLSFGLVNRFIYWGLFSPNTTVISGFGPLGVQA